MAYTAFLSRIRALFRADPDRHLERIADAFSRGTLIPPTRPMTDQELSRAIREFQSQPASDRSLRRLAKRLEDIPRGRTKREG